MKHTESRTTGDLVLSTADITKKFGGLVALADVSVRVAPASIVGLVGPNGAGKSTLFNVMSGYLRPTSGSVFIDGVEQTRRSGPQHRATMGVARTFQHPELFSDLTIREHLVLAKRVRSAPRRLWTDLLKVSGLRMSTATRDDTVDALLEDLSLTDDAERLAVGLPLGVARRVEVGRALITDPRVVLLDDPSSGLDESETRDLAQVLRDARIRHSVALVLVEHDVDLVLGLSDEVYVLDFGKLIAHGTPEEIRRDPAVRAAYLGDDPGTAAPDSPAPEPAGLPR
ncbi:MULTISPECIES: ABC transporter ATP-binding protein [Gordonia]|uniref:ABC transporter ATP-binding protein n=1 Tax=Gordonia TaxID=2053 RepID=UPI0004B66231|nr:MULTISPECIES: ABC transporter ATP-binding protein [Gordonia]MDH3008748.1 ABC transporter ATP-binding protein [Gordonia alkanivorans]MDH3017683.1 ABC transporter ATP-binding protein [Gordonia alkanivorans]MDH3022033.1 ABC transporter ATP-binding protein [Gordonia alkanivorans]MDH3043053.1 ABC transporter ATP-binding protein [Gordonia alkanivorans]MDH3051762.1 ABC transporter ATP-binding protein [Gordonia alkanivorans]